MERGGTRARDTVVCMYVERYFVIGGKHPLQLEWNRSHRERFSTSDIDLINHPCSGPSIRFIIAWKSSGLYETFGFIFMIDPDRNSRRVNLFFDTMSPFLPALQYFQELWAIIRNENGLKIMFLNNKI